MGANFLIDAHYAKKVLREPLSVCGIPLVAGGKPIIIYENMTLKKLRMWLRRKLFFELC